MELDSGTVTAIVSAFGVTGATVTGFVSKLIFGRIDDLKADVKELKAQVATVVGKLEECNEEHAKSREKVAGLEATISVLAKHQPQQVQSEAKAASEAAHGR